MVAVYNHHDSCLHPPISATTAAAAAAHRKRVLHLPFKKQHKHPPPFEPVPLLPPSTPAASLAPSLPPPLVQHHPPIPTDPPPAPARFPPKLVETYSVEGPLGSGGFGHVHAGRRRHDSQPVAIKSIVRERVPRGCWYDDPELGRVPVEVFVLKRVRHPAIVGFMDVFEDEQHVFLVMELHGAQWSSASPSRDLFECVERKPLAEAQARRVFRQVCEAVRYLEGVGVYHRDLKDENVVVDREFRVKLIDFGSALVYPSMRAPPLQDRFYGTLQYAAPEVLLGRRYRPQPAEVWSLGVLLYTILAGDMPFDDPWQAVRRPHKPLPVGIGAACRDLVAGMLEKDPERRLCLTEILSHPWLAAAP
ncbi:uncharacterized protein VTP21DRAFT_5394 [Calcarisporiella thermophila]|uniref:uncharacterized protein n=1 Tax=Calcarisporiella thermophila TaxID=911321 RepID=UPI003743F133